MRPITLKHAHAKVAFYALVAYVVTLQPGCSLFHRRVTRQEEAASVNIGVLAVTPWAAYRAAVQPTFQLTPDQAFTAAIPNTADFQTKLLNALAGNLQVAASPGGTAPTLGSKPSAPTAKTASELPDGSTLATPIGVDPILKTDAAAAYYEHVQILNRYIKDAFRGETDWTPYLVQLQVSVMPRLRNLPVDTYVDISLIPGPWGADVRGMGAKTKVGAPTTITDTMVATTTTNTTTTTLLEPLAEIKELSDALGDTLNSVPKKIVATGRVRVIPLLVTDDLEAAMDSRSLDTLRQETVLLSATYKGVAGAADIERLNEKLHTILGHDLNSTFTIARVTDSTVRCRFGALYETASRYSMVPQAHTVPLLVLIRSGAAQREEDAARTIRLVTKTTMVDVASNHTLSERSPRDSYGDLLRALHRRHIRPRCTVADLNAGRRDGHCGVLHHLLGDIAASNWESFIAHIWELDPDAPLGDVPYIFNELTAAKAYNPVQTATLVVPRHYLPELVTDSHGNELPPDLIVNTYPQTQNPVLVDDKKTSASLTIFGTTGLEPEEVDAVLEVGSSSSSVRHALPATNIKSTSDGHGMIATFPSPEAFFKPTPATSLAYKASLYLRTDNSFGLKPRPLIRDRPCRYLAPTDVEGPKFHLTVRAKFVDANSDGTAKLEVVVANPWQPPSTSQPPPPPAPAVNAVLTVSGADVTAATAAAPSTIVATADGWRIQGDTTVHLTLANTSPMTPVVITATEAVANGKSVSVQLPVVAGQPARAAAPAQ